MKRIVILLVLFIIIFVAILLVVLNNARNVTEEPELEQSTIAVKEETNKYIEEIFERYINSYKDNSVQELKAMVDEENYDIFGLLNDEDNQIAYYINEIYSYDNLAGIIYFVELKSYNNPDAYIVINMDYTNYSFKIIKSTQKEYEDMKKGIINDQYKKYTKVERNSCNAFSL